MVLSPEEYQVFRLIVYAIGVPIIIALCVSIVRRLKAIKELDAQLREEAAQKPLNPYEQMAALYEQQEARDLLAKAKRGKVR
jgi:hypothetical protein